MIYDVNGSAVLPVKDRILVAAVLGAGSDSNRFTAMKELLDIGKKKLANPNAVISSDEFSHASYGAVCEFPSGVPGMYEKYTFDLLYSKAETTAAIPASTTKVMSLITGLDYVDNLKEVIALTSNDIQGGSGPSFAAGDTMTIEELMLSMMLPSSNTAAQAFARVCGNKMLQTTASGTYTDSECVEKFILEMNTKAAYIGMTDSTFTTASGLLTTTYMTAKDAIQMLVEACSYPEILKVWNKKTYTIAVGGTNPRNVTLTTTVTNQAIENDYTILGGKTGILGNGSSAAALVMVAKIK